MHLTHLRLGMIQGVIGGFPSAEYDVGPHDDSIGGTSWIEGIKLQGERHELCVI